MPLKRTYDISEAGGLFGGIANRIPGHAARALDKEANAILARSQRLVPVKTGRLQRSGRRLKVRVGRKGASVKIKYGRKSVPYATAVHQRTDVNHPQGQAKYLEDAVKARTRGMGGRIAGLLDKSIGG